MKKVIIVFVIVLGVALAVATLSSSNRKPISSNRDGSAGVNNERFAPPVPAFFKDATSALPLKRTLDPEQFSGKTRRAYEVAREIPETLAQLPCYCYCDRGFGHKSLHSCYEDDHSAHCSTCVDEALMAYQLETEQKLSASQIRALIIEKFSR